MPAASTHGPTGRRRPRAALAGVAALLLLALSGCSREEFLRFGWPEGITPQAEKMRELWSGSVVAALIVGVVVWGLIFWVVVRYRKRSETPPKQVRENLPLEVLYTILPVLIVAVLFFYTATTQTYVDKISRNPDVRVEVVASKWNWKFRYTGQNGADETAIETVGASDQIPVLVVPTDRTIRFTEKSTDVIHSFWVPELLFKRDVIPGHVNQFEVQIRPTKTGAYVGRCAELCGTYHSQMNFELRVVSPDKYAQWLAARAQGQSNPQALESIGEAPLATTTRPFDTQRTSTR